MPANSRPHMEELSKGACAKNYVANTNSIWDKGQLSGAS